MEYVDSIFRQDATVPEIAEKTLSVIEIPGDESAPVLISTRIIHELKLAQPLSNDIMVAILKILEKRDRRITTAHKEVNDGKQHFVAHKRSYFFPADTLQAIERDIDIQDPLFQIFPQGFVLHSILKL